MNLILDFRLPITPLERKKPLSFSSLKDEIELEHAAFAFHIEIRGLALFALQTPIEWIEAIQRERLARTSRHGSGRVAVSDFLMLNCLYPKSYSI
jgi:hypothetical protein